MKHATSAPSELGGEHDNVSRSRARTHVLLQAQKLHVYWSGTSGAFWTRVRPIPNPISKYGETANKETDQSEFESNIVLNAEDVFV